MHTTLTTAAPPPPSPLACRQNTNFAAAAREKSQDIYILLRLGVAVVVHLNVNATVLVLTTVDRTSVQCNGAAGFLHARQKAASHGNLASQDVDTSQVQDAGHPDHGAPPQRRDLLPQSMSAVLSRLRTKSPALCNMLPTCLGTNGSVHCCPHLVVLLRFVYSSGQSCSSFVPLVL